MILIASGAYILNEFAVEIGKLPPAFLPLANRRLYELQIQYLNTHFKEQIYLTIPKNYDLNRKDIEKLKKLDVSIIRVNENQMLGDSISEALNKLNIKNNDILRILFGDTLITEYQDEINYIGCVEEKFTYNWQQENYKLNNKNFKKMSGADILVLVKLIILETCC